MIIYLDSATVTDVDVNIITIGDQTVEQFANNQPAAASVETTYDQNQYYSDKSGSYVANNNTQMGCCEWSLNQDYSPTPFANGFPLSSNSPKRIKVKVHTKELKTQKVENSQVFVSFHPSNIKHVFSIAPNRLLVRL